MKDFRKTAGAAGIFALIYTFCMYHNSASITFPILMAAGIGLLYFLQEQRKILDDPWSGFYVVNIMLIAVSVFLTADAKLIFMSKTVVLVLYLCLAIDLYCNDRDWTDVQYIRKCMGFVIKSFWKGFEVLNDCGKYKKEQKELEEIQGVQGMDRAARRQNLWKVGKGLLIAGALLLVILPLMMGADVVFENMVTSIFDIDRIFEVLFVKMDLLGLGFTFGAMFLVAYGFIKILARQPMEHRVTQGNSGDVITGVTILGVVGFVYVVFSIVELRGMLFSNVKLPENYTYAQYAREGFFELLWLAVINMLIVLVCRARFEVNKMMKILLYVMCGCTYVMIFCSAYKMILYVSVYHMTFLRIMVLWSLVVLAVLMVAVIRYIYREDFKLFKTFVVVVTALYLIVAFARPDYVIAAYNLANEKDPIEYCNNYYVDLSVDAIPLLVQYEGESGGRLRYYDRIHNECKERNSSLRKLNLAYIQAQKALESVGR
ncbi:MAG: DUF4153 domain-containing protein [Lachnospiraceae bacterium]